MIDKYLKERTKILKERIQADRNRYEHNQIAIAESNTKIDELENAVDEASEIFSIKAREDSDFNKHEIKDIELKIAAYVCENKNLANKISATEKELNIVEQCLKELSDNNVSRETLEQNNDELLFDTEISNKSLFIKKLVFCRDIAEVDGKRVKIELDNIIKNIDV